MTTCPCDCHNVACAVNHYPGKPCDHSVCKSCCYAPVKSIKQLFEEKGVNRPAFHVDEELKEAGKKAAEAFEKELLPPLVKSVGFFNLHDFRGQWAKKADKLVIIKQLNSKIRKENDEVIEKLIILKEELNVISRELEVIINNLKP